MLELTQGFISDPEKAKTFVRQLEATVDKRMEIRLEPLATKADMQKELNALRLEVRDQKVELMDVIQNQKSELLKTIYIVGFVQFLGIVGSVLAIFTFLG